MAELVTNCPRCNSQKITFNVIADNYLGISYRWQRHYELFCVCRNCDRATIFLANQKEINDAHIFEKSSLPSLQLSLNQILNIDGFINLADMSSAAPPDYLPPDIEAIFIEGAKCQAIGAHNAAGTMFRLCVDIATATLLPKEEISGLNPKIRRDLGLRLPWLFDNKKIQEDLRELSSCIKDDGNDAAHRGTLSKEDSEDLLDFTFELLERMYTEPERIKIASARRIERRNKN